MGSSHFNDRHNLLFSKKIFLKYFHFLNNQLNDQAEL
jgi:hypothetical protein